MKRLHLASLVSCIAGLVTVLPVHAESPRIVDAVGKFIVYYNRSQSQPMSERVQRFNDEIVPLAPKMYERLFDYSTNVQHIAKKERISENLKQFPSIERRFKLLYTQVAPMLESYLERFQHQFPNFKMDDVTVYILHSLGGANGNADVIDGKTVFYLGVDMMAKCNDYANQEPFFDHEFFHVYHLQKFKLTDEVYSQLWMEGLATYVAKSMNPQATDQELMLNETLVKKTSAILPSLLKTLSADLEKPDTDRKLRFKYFNVDSRSSTVPSRAGYYIGYLIAQELAKSATIAEMTSWTPQEVLPKIKEALQTISQQQRK